MIFGLLILIITLQSGFLSTLDVNRDDPWLMSSEFVFRHAPFKSCHASTIAETEEGVLVVAWFGGTHEKNKDVEIWMSRKSDNQWIQPYSVANGIYEGKRYPCWNPVLYQVPDGELLLFYKVGPDPENWWGMLKRSFDDGNTWSDPERLPEGILGPIKNKPVLLSNGKLLCPSSTEHNGWHVHVESTTDFGRTWLPVKKIDPDSPFEVIQPSILRTGEKSLTILCRSMNGIIVTSRSDDLGSSWSPLMPTDLPNPNSGIDAVTMDDNRHLLVYNHSSKPEDQWGGERHPLNLAISEDGQSWQASVVLEEEPGEYSYPAVIQGLDGMVHIVYTWKRQRIKYVKLDPEYLPLRPLSDWQE